jgi:hypothetical protein
MLSYDRDTLVVFVDILWHSYTLTRFEGRTLSCYSKTLQWGPNLEFWIAQLFSIIKHL